MPPAKTASAVEPAHPFPALRLPVRPPLPPMEAKAVARLPLDGEIVISGSAGLDFDALLQRIHPAASRIARLARETPAAFYGFDLLVDERGKSWMGEPLAARRERLERFFAALPATSPDAALPAANRPGTSLPGASLPGTSLRLSPATRERRQAERWLEELAAAGLDGVMAKLLDSPYLPGERDAMVKVKRARTADCVVGGFRWAQAGGKLGSLLLGLYDEEGLLDHVGFCASFNDDERREIARVVVPLVEPPGFTGRAPGGPSRWSQGRSTDWEPLRPILVCEVRYDHFSGGRFRHGTKFLRWRPDKEPR